MSDKPMNQTEEIRQKAIYQVLEGIRQIVPLNWGYAVVLCVPEDIDATPDNGRILGEIVPASNAPPHGVIMLFARGIDQIAQGGHAEIYEYTPPEDQVPQ